METLEQQELLGQGEYIITSERRRICTVLGSCVAVTLFCPRTQDAAVCHGILSRPGGEAGKGRLTDRPGRYLSEVLPLMLDHFYQRACRPSEIEAKVFGGATLMPHAGGAPAEIEVGIDNVATALGVLLGSGIRVRASNTGGTLAHRIIFDTGNGEVLHQLLRQNAAKTPDVP